MKKLLFLVTFFVILWICSVLLECHRTMNIFSAWLRNQLKYLFRSIQKNGTCNGSQFAGVNLILSWSILCKLWLIAFSQIKKDKKKIFFKDRIVLIKGQTKSKYFFQANISSKKTNKFNFTTTYDTSCTEAQVDLFLFVFWKKLKTPKRHFEINWPLDGSMKEIWSDPVHVLFKMNKLVYLQYKGIFSTFFSLKHGPFPTT